MTGDEEVLEQLGGLSRQVSLFSDVSQEECVNEMLKRTARSESVNLLEGQSDASSTIVPNFQFLEGLKQKSVRGGSVYKPPKISESLLEKSEKFLNTDSAKHLKDRGLLRYMVQSGEIEKARNLLKSKY